MSVDSVGLEYFIGGWHLLIAFRPQESVSFLSELGPGFLQ